MLSQKKKATGRRGDTRGQADSRSLRSLSSAYRSLGSMVFMLENGETIIFKHRAKLSDVSGELLMTTFRLAWTPSIPLEANDFQSPWSNIRGMQFSPPTDTRVCTKVDTLVGAGSAKGIVFFLEGTDKEKELLRLKAEFKKIRSSTGGGGGGSGGTVPPPPPPPHSKKRPFTPHDDSADTALRESRLKQRKAELLAADQHLAKSYRELVEQSRILSAEEFWDNQVNPTLLEDKESQVQRQGRLSIAEIVRNCIKQNVDGTASISINKDDRQSIMDSDPTCRRAYAELVPLQKSENEFWTLYLEKYYSGVTPQTEELFSRFQSGVMEKGTAAGAIREVAQRSIQLESNTDLGFNLLANYSDSRKSENLATEDVLHDLKKDVMQLNNESQRVMAPLRREVARGVNGTARKNSSIPKNQGEEYSSELLSEIAPPYIPLSVAHLRYGQDPEVYGADKADSGKDTAVKVSAFGKASGGIARGGAKRPPYEPKSALDVEFGLWGAFPSSERANTLLVQDRVALRAAAAAAHQNAGLQGLGTSSLCSATNLAYGRAALLGAVAGITDTATTTTTTTRYEDFRQEMLEAFVEVTELMRHFFSILVREGAEAPKPGTDGAGKVGKLIDRLLARKEQLTAKSRGIRETKRFDEVELEASTAIINDMVKQIGRASSWWTEYCAR